MRGVPVVNFTFTGSDSPAMLSFNRTEAMPNVFRELAHALAALTTNCAQFHEAWDKARSANGVEGRWRGEWRSEVNGHHGPIDCVLAASGEYLIAASFHAEYSKVLRVCYTVQLQAERVGDGFRLRGEADLGRLAGGVYSYEGELSTMQLLCRYRCRYDHGMFDLKPVDV